MDLCMSRGWGLCAGMCAGVDLSCGLRDVGARLKVPNVSCILAGRGAGRGSGWRYRAWSSADVLSELEGVRQLSGPTPSWLASARRPGLS